MFASLDQLNTTYHVYDQNLEWHSGMGGGWHPIGVSEDEDDVVFDLELLIEIIADMLQVEGVDLICKENNPVSI